MRKTKPVKLGDLEPKPIPAPEPPSVASPEAVEALFPPPVTPTPTEAPKERSDASQQAAEEAAENARKKLPD